jgi:hypothetical protein
MAAEEFLQRLQLALIQQTKLNHPAVKHRLVIAETLFGTIHELQGRRRELQTALGGILHHSPGLQCRKRTHIYRLEITSFIELEFKMPVSPHLLCHRCDRETIGCPSRSLGQ